MNFFEPMVATAVLLGAGVLAAHAKVAGSAVIVHHATHARLNRNAGLNRWIAEAVSIVTLGIGFDEYRRVHGRHHGSRTFARPGPDEEAQALVVLGFAPGEPEAVLWRRFWLTPLNPLWHLRSSWARLRANFISRPPRRRVAAWVSWGSAVAGAAALGVVPGLAGAVATMLVAGNIGSYLEQVSRHSWAVPTESEGLARQLELANWRLPSPHPPARWTLGSTLRFAGSVFLKALTRISVCCGDLTHHAAHHLGWDARVPGHDPAWADTAQAYSERLRADPALHAHVHGSLLGAVGAWFRALAKAPPLSLTPPRS
jgi:fatty acid desaturase